MYSTDDGENWSTNAIQRVSLDTGTNDQWMPVIAVKPDGNQLFVGWNDRRLDTNDNSLIDVYGRFAPIASNGEVTFAETDFRITTESFQPAFAGTLGDNIIDGHYDPVWPPGATNAWVNLQWGYPWFPPPPGYPGDEVGTWLQGVNCTLDTYCHEHGEHNGAFADASRVYVVWSDNRSGSLGTAYIGRKQGDIRLARVPWPQY